MTDPAPVPDPVDQPACGIIGAGGAPQNRRLWFHLDDVLPLATHATSTPRHALTRAQLLAHAPLMAALAWTDEHGVDALISNGEPGWYDPTGLPHTARACTWIRRTTDGRAVTDPVAGRTGYLPLRTFGYHCFHVIDWLRHAADRGAHWLSLDISRPHPVISPDRLSVSEQRDDSYPPDACWTAATVACVPELGGGGYPALITENYHSRSGGEIARFDRATVTRIIADLHQARDAADYQPGWHAVLRWAGARLEVLEEHQTAGIPVLRRYDVIGPDHDGRYPLGAFLWTWLRTDPT